MISLDLTKSSDPSKYLQDLFTARIFTRSCKQNCLKTLLKHFFSNVSSWIGIYSSHSLKCLDLWVIQRFQNVKIHIIWFWPHLTILELLRSKSRNLAILRSLLFWFLRTRRQFRKPHFKALFWPQTWNCSHSEVQAFYEKGLMSPNSTQNFKEKTFHQLL